MPTQSEDTKTAKAILKGLDSNSLNPNIVAYHLANGPEAARIRFLELIEQYIAQMSIAFDEGAFGNSDEYYRTLIKCRKIQDTIDQYKKSV